MRTTILFLISLFMFTTSVEIYAAAETETVPMEPKRRDVPDKRNRIPARACLCTIDFMNKTIAGDFDSDLVIYEIWNESGEYVVSASDNEDDIIEFLLSNRGAFQLRFYSPTCVYIGYIFME